MASQTKHIPLASIVLDAGTQLRVSVDQAVIDEYAERMRAGAVFPPVKLFMDDQTYWPGDGHCRITAAKAIGAVEILAVVTKGTLRDAMLYACGANQDHGLRRTNEDKRRATMVCLEDEEWRRWSNMQIAKHCGVSEHFVRSLRPRRSDQESRTYRTKQGKTATMRTARIGKRRSPPPGRGRGAHRRGCVSGLPVRRRRERCLSARRRAGWADAA